VDGASVHDPYFFTDEPLDATGPSGGADRIVLHGDDAHHLTVVRRARAGDRVCVSDGAGTIVEGRVTALTPAAVEVERLNERRVPKPAPAVRVFQALAKGAKVDLVVTKLVELGVDEVVVFTSGRSVPRWDPPKRRQMAGRWTAIAREAAKQSRRAWLPRVEGPVTAADAALMVQGLEGRGLALLADESSATPLRDVLSTPQAAFAATVPGDNEVAHRVRREAEDAVAVIVGPEGGLTAGERAAFVSAGAVAFSLGPQILRTETAALAAAALVLHHAGRLG
jgi:16S rRNA (uracil1498-N3)-methyltransferase